MNTDTKVKSTFLQKDIEELPGLTRLQIYDLHIRSICRVYHLFMDGYTCEDLDREIGKSISQAVNDSFEKLGFNGRLSQQVAAGALYAFYNREKRQKLLALDTKAPEILADVHWGTITAAEMAHELSLPEQHIKTIIQKALEILES